jgi:hypothetical protein
VIKIRNSQIQPYGEVSELKVKLDELAAHRDVSVELDIVVGHADEETPFKFEMYITAPPLTKKKCSALNKERTRYETNNIEASFIDFMEQYQKKSSCEHDWHYLKDRHGQELKDGMGLCVRCGLKGADVLPVDKTQSVICMHDEKEGDIVCHYPWPEGVFIQGGTWSLNLTTGEPGGAFAESFPTINGIETYLRGEGETPLLAEGDCWTQFSKQSACKHHEWSREFKNRVRTDGYARCIHCEIKGTVLKPTTTCSVCEKPTSNKFGEQTICLTHQYEMDIEEYITIYSAQKGMFGESMADREANERFKFPMMQHLLAQHGESAYTEHRTYWIRIFMNTQDAIVKHMTGDDLNELEMAHLSDPITGLASQALKEHIDNWKADEKDPL